MHSGWYYEKTDLLNTPSIKDGLDVQMEKRFRREGARFIIDVGADLSLRYDTVASGCVYFHRFFMFHSFKEFNKHVTALGCLFLAGKVEETPKKCKDLLRVAKLRLTDEQYACFGEDPKEEIMVIERVLLQTIKFDLQVEHPYQFLIKYAKSLKVSKDKTGMESLVQMAWTFINDSLCTTICLEYEPEIVAIALMYLASRLGKFQINDWTGRKNSEQEKWWDQFVEDLTLELLEDICHQVLDLYSPTAVSAKPPIITPSASGAKVSPPIVVQNIVVTQAKSNVSVMSMVRSAAPPPTLPPPIVQNPPPPLPPPAAAILPQVYAPSGSGPYACPVTFIPPPGGAAIPPRSAPPPAAPAPYGYPPPPPHHPQYAYYPQPPQVPQMPTYATPQAYNVPPPNQQRPPPLMPPEYGGNMVQQQQRQIGTPPIVGGQQPPPPLLYPPQQQRSMMMRKPPPHGARY